MGKLSYFIRLYMYIVGHILLLLDRMTITIILTICRPTVGQ